MLNWESIGIFSGIVAAATWYIKHLISTSSKAQLIQFQEHEKSQNAKILEVLKSDLGLQSELKKIRYSSIYERKVNALLDVYACLQEYEASIGKISEDVIDHSANHFLQLYPVYLAKKDELSTKFWNNAALFDDDVVSQYQEYRRNVIMDYDSVYKAMSKNLTKIDSYFSRLPELEFETGKFSSNIKYKVKTVLNNS
ncbi:hypothetical protein [Pseudoalteromonas luteoviolacea]|uniref:Uncharacterized protein n=1 Tax=Pseudoalteromonas luteoviolacea S4054 TaxID=1129367 RepID=A0A0F6ABZ2_9GAMM|nr:hypothetical protein [Pseudoalteromonas luteoviolacea]AOT08760.1 hypothetical protein S4054249_13250 [Pseudoalteromonas luteoviolacea]AOT13674.1 hypothetical protein S40542_13220 [Pseudoalteromonas luteoviolacea]AOT18588.1 hypothetical protein S4054_13225 [Pseudoalteromonas luteoviolacea]KKE82904.1 hypothetical protein N479_15960 [Pseudoalteromonas luteoviolacea S4054]KZN72732.1 hypothetical protein N481_01030 [Pseudoalteromonas luteoviolacea S4047-1]